MATNSGHLRNALKIVIVGDARVGKTWLLSRAQELYATLCDGYSLLRRPFDSSLAYCETSFETYFTNVDTSDLGNYQTNIWDTGGSGFFNFLRPLAYICADVFMLCFDLTNRDSFNNVTKRWLPELRKYQPQTPILIVGTKCDLLDEAESNVCLIPSDEAKHVAEKVGCLYQETSALTGHQVADAFERAVQLGHTKRKAEAGQAKRSQIFKEGFDPTWIPPIRSPPEIKIEPSTYTSDFQKVLECSTNADVLFTFEDGSQSILAHAVMLWLTPSVFKDLLQDENASSWEQFKDLFKNDSHASVNLKTNGQIGTVIVVKKWISRDTFVTILEFIYTGVAGISKDTEKTNLQELLFASEKLHVRSLVEICNYYLKLAETKQDCDNQQNSSHRRKKILQPCPMLHTIQQGMFLDKESTVFSDVTFLVEDTLVYAHKAILVSRSPFWAALLSGNFREGYSSQVHLPGIDCQSFLAMLEYLYTDNCPSLERIPVENLLILADKLCLSRLVQICEHFLIKDLQQVVTASSILAQEFVDALSFSKIFNANQLTKWCLHFIALNYQSFQCNTRELDSLIKDDKPFIEERQWPPKEYLEALEDYKLGANGITAVAAKLLRKKQSCFCRIKCSIM